MELSPFVSTEFKIISCNMKHVEIDLNGLLDNVLILLSHYQRGKD